MIPCLLQTFYCTSVFQLLGMGIPWYVFIIVLMPSTTIWLWHIAFSESCHSTGHHISLCFNDTGFLSIWFSYVMLSLWILSIWMYKGHLTYFLLCKIDLSHLNIQTSALKQENSEFFALISHDVYVYMCVKRCQSLDIKIYQKKNRL